MKDPSFLVNTQNFKGNFFFWLGTRYGIIVKTFWKIPLKYQKVLHWPWKNNSSFFLFFLFAIKRFINPVKLLHKLEESLDDNSIIVADGGDFVGTAAYILR